MTALLVALALFLTVLAAALTCRHIDNLPPRKDS